VNLFPNQLCVISSVEAAGSVKLACLDVATRLVTHITASSVQEADRMVLSTFCTSAVLATIGLLALVTLGRLLAFVHLHINRKGLAKMESLGFRRLDPDLEMFLSKRAVEVMAVEESLGYFRKEKLE
jgi:hypothetical protein